MENQGNYKHVGDGLYLGESNLGEGLPVRFALTWGPSTRDEVVAFIKPETAANIIHEFLVGGVVFPGLDSFIHRRQISVQCPYCHADVGNVMLRGRFLLSDGDVDSFPMSDDLACENCHKPYRATVAVKLLTTIQPIDIRAKDVENNGNA